MGGRSMLNKNGWGLREMLLLSGILILFLFVAIFYIMSFYKEMDKDMSRNYYRDLESDLKERAQVYIDDYYDGEFSGEITITRNVLRLYDLDVHLEDEEGKEHPITCIDLAGELVKCMYKQDAGEPLTDEQQSVLRTLTDVLIDNRTENRKIHFFVIEYGAEDREYDGLPQKDYLEAAVAYIQRTGIFKKDTDGLFLLITKVDKAKVLGKDLLEKLRLYISENYQGFYNGLKKICKDNEINGGDVEIQPFTLGEVCFQNYCKFKEETAAAVVRTIMKRSYGYKPGKIKKVFDILKG